MPPKGYRKIREEQINRFVVANNSGGTNEVPEDFRLVTREIVATPGSAPTRGTSSRGRGGRNSRPENDGEDDDEPSTQTPAKANTRGPCGLKKTYDLVKQRGRRFSIGWCDTFQVHTTDDQRGLQPFIMAIGTVTRSVVPLTKSTLSDHGPQIYDKILEELSPYFQISREETKLGLYIMEKANGVYSRWKTSVRRVWEQFKTTDVVPQYWQERPEAWAFLNEHFASDTYQKLQTTMKEIRKSQKKLRHTSGPISFATRALKRKAESSSCVAPSVEAWCQVHVTNHRDYVERVQTTLANVVEEVHASQPPPTDDTSESVQSVVPLDIVRQAEILEDILGPSKGTKVHGMGSMIVRTGRTRGATQGSRREEQLEEQVRLVIQENELLKKRLEEKEEYDRIQREEERIQREEETKKRDEYERISDERYRDLAMQLSQLQKGDGSNADGGNS